MPSLRNEAAYFLLKFFCALIAKLPVRAVMRIAKSLGGIFCFFSKRRKVAYADLKKAFGDRFSSAQRKAVVGKHFQHLAMTGAEVLRFPFLTEALIKSTVKIVGWPNFEKALSANKGGIFLTAHFGNWEMMQIISSFLAEPIMVLAREQQDKKLNSLLNRLRESHGATAIQRGMGLRDFIRALREKKFVGVVGDQDAGKYEGVILSLFGRKTTFPTGAFDLARRTQVPIVPCFMYRLADYTHELHLLPPIFCDSETPLEEPMKEFIQSLETMVSKHPEQWLWGAKRWKYTWTKKIVVLSDGKPGHAKQSQALSQLMQTIPEQYARPGMEYPAETVEVQFQSIWHRRLFPWVAFFLLPWAQGRLSFLKFFLSVETFQKIENLSADFFISAGTSLVPLNLCLAEESQAKSVVLMKPAFPFNLKRYDLAVIPRHDQGLMPKGTRRMLLALSPADREDNRKAAEVLRRDIADPEKVKTAVFLGGKTRNYCLTSEEIKVLFSQLELSAQQSGGYLVTTSRRTPDEICFRLKEDYRAQRMPSCQLLVLACEDKRPEVVPGMMGLAEVLIVAEDSISMISEAVLSGKKVIVLQAQAGRLPQKHQRFLQMLKEEHLAFFAKAEQMAEIVRKISSEPFPLSAGKQELQDLKTRLVEIL